jgi:hypothetical protein
MSSDWEHARRYDCTYIYTKRIRGPSFGAALAALPFTMPTVTHLWGFHGDRGVRL